MKTNSSNDFRSRLTSLFAFSFSSGVPISLVYGTLQAWLVASKTDLTQVGFFTMAGLPYSLKFLWAPLLDQYTPHFLGKRRGWIFITQISLFISLTGMAFSDPIRTPWTLGFFSFLTAFFSASQDIVVDVYRSELLSEKEHGVGSAFSILGYRIGATFSGALGLIFSDILTWKQVYLMMAFSILLSMINTFVSKETHHPKEEKTSLRKAIFAPFKEIFGRKASISLLFFTYIYKLDVALAQILITHFFLEIGLSRTKLGILANTYGLAGTIIGGFVGGFSINKLGLGKCLFYFEVLQMFSGGLFFWLARNTASDPILCSAILIESFASGIGTAALIAFFIRICHPKFTTTQFALLSSISLMTRNTIGGAAGYFVKLYGWDYYFLFSTFMALPGLALLVFYETWMSERQKIAPLTHAT